MMAATRPATLLDRLPPVRGRLTANAPLGPFTWFRVGGAAEVLFRPLDADDLAAFLAACDDTVTLLGAASNVIVRDGGIPGVVIRLGRNFAEIAAHSAGVIAGAGALDLTVAEHAAAHGLCGLEFLSGIPGSIGGAVAMNAGAYGVEVKDRLQAVDMVLRDGRRQRLDAAALGFGYRQSGLPDGAVVIRAHFSVSPGDAAPRMAEIRTMREATQPVRARTGGSTFKNPPGHSAWQLIDAAGCRGLTLGGAQVSEKHANFLLNTGTATAADIEGLGEEVRRRVLAATGITLEWEIRRLGVPLRRLEAMP
jgi:UDP-N-acetylmuramate dehydrogenase